MPTREHDTPRVANAIVGIFVATWVISLAVWRFGHIEERWSQAVNGS